MNLYPIRTVSELTGVPTTTLRAWERRYGMLKPNRTPKGHRLYSSEDIDLIKEIVVLLKSDHTISKAISILKDPDYQSTESDTRGSHWLTYRERMLKSVEQFNEQNLDKAYNDALSIYPIDAVTEHVIVPLLKTLGNRWDSRPAGIAEEHFFSNYLRNKLGARLHHESYRANGTRILVSCLPDEYHELGILLFCIAAIGHGYRILYLGTNMPLLQLPLVVQRTEVAAILLSGSQRDQWDRSLASELKTCIQSLEMPFMFGGDFSEAFKDQIQEMGAHNLGSDHVNALEKMETIIPAFTRK